jgi:hypothetical protein
MSVVDGSTDCWKMLNVMLELDPDPVYLYEAVQPESRVTERPALKGVLSAP